MGQKGLSTRTRARKAAVLERLLLGYTRTAACEGIVRRSVFYRWLEGADFAEAVDEAEADALRLVESYELDVLRTDTQARHWWLARRWPRLYGDPATRIEHSGAVSHVVVDSAMLIAAMKAADEVEAQEGA